MSLKEAMLPNTRSATLYAEANPVSWSVHPPKEADEIAALYYKQIQAARDDSDDQPMTSPAFAREYEEQIERAREEARRQTRNRLTRRMYAEGLATQSELAEVVEMSQSNVSKVIASKEGEPLRRDHATAESA